MYLYVFQHTVSQGVTFTDESADDVKGAVVGISMGIAMDNLKKPFEIELDNQMPDPFQIDFTPENNESLIQVDIKDNKEVLILLFTQVSAGSTFNYSITVRTLSLIY